MKSAYIRCVIAGALFCALAPNIHAADDNTEKKRNDVRTMAQVTLQRLYEADPKAKAAVENAAGYAVFSNLGVKILVAAPATAKASPSTIRAKKKPS